MKVDSEGWLVAEAGDPLVRRHRTVRTYPLAVPAPLGIVWHWTGGRGGPHFAEALAHEIETYKKDDRPASWHVLIAKDGTIHQSAAFNVGAWHVGKPGVIAGKHFDNVNRATVGCELENAGRLRKIGDKFYCWPFFSNPSAPERECRADPHCAVEADRAVIIDDGFFDAFTPAQEASAFGLLAALVSRFGWTRDVSAYGHVDFDYPRKEDPGPLWKQVLLPRVLDKVFGIGGAIASASTPAHLAERKRGTS